MGELEKLIKLREINLGPSPIEIPNMGRAQLAVLFKQLGYKIGVEVGVYKGEFSEVICKANPKVKLFCIDPYAQNPYYERMEGAYREAKKRLVLYNANFIISYSATAVKKFADNSLDFVYLDGDHSLQAVTEDLACWYPKLRSGGRKSVV